MLFRSGGHGASKYYRGPKRGPSISTNVLGEALVSFSAWLTALGGLPKNNKLDFNLVNPSSSIEPRYLNRIEARG